MDEILVVVGLGGATELLVPAGLDVLLPGVAAVTGVVLPGVSSVVVADVSGVVVAGAVGVSWVGLGWVGVGCACWANSGADGSARAAAIAVVALIRAMRWVIIIAQRTLPGVRGEIIAKLHQQSDE